MTARQKDRNGFVTINNNPITRAGVFQYLGKNLPGAAEPDRIYNVFRSPEELMKKECIDSFKLLPIVNDHTMIGDGYIPAEQKGVHGATGEDVAFDAGSGVLSSNIKIYSETVKKLIDGGKKHLSLGYKCSYMPSSGTFDGQKYDYIQKDLRGNHLALVDKSRCDVLVLDRHVAMDYADINLELNKPDLQEPPMSLTKEDITAIVTEALKPVHARFTAMDEAEEAEKKAAEDKAAKDAAEEEEKKKEAADKAAKDAAEGKTEEEKKTAEDKKTGMDAAEFKKLSTKLDNFIASGKKDAIREIAQRDALAAKLSPHIGTFDHADKTLDEVAKYGAEKLGLKVAEGTEAIALDGFLHNRPAPHKLKAVGIGMDSAVKKTGESQVDKFVKTASKK